MEKLCLLSLVFSIWCNCYGSERDVFLHIFENYDKRIRPVKNTDTTTTVGVQFILISLLQVNGEQEYATMAVFFKLNWTDEYLKWNPADFNGTDFIRAHLNEVWHPDMAIMTMSMETQHFIAQEDTVIGINYTGEVEYSFPFLLNNYCPMQGDMFPFDSQTCIIKVNSGCYSSKFICMENVPRSSTEPRYQNTEWTIMPYTNNSVDVVREWAGEDEKYRQVQYIVTFKRNPAYYIWVIIVPTFIISALCIAGIFAPFSSAGVREEKVTVGLTTLLTLAVILSLVTGQMPKGTKLPVLGLFILTELLLCALSVAIAVAISYLHEAAATRSWTFPNWLLCFCYKLDNRIQKGEDTETEYQIFCTRCHKNNKFQRKANEKNDRFQNLENTLYAVHNAN